jgi:hypothetical protein
MDGMTSKILWGLIILTTALVTLVDVAVQEYLIAVFAFALGSLWLILEINQKASSSSIFFLLFIILAIVGSLHNAPIPTMLLALTTDLTAWDLSRFQARVIHEAASDRRAALETKHLQKLGVTMASGFLLALSPLLVQLSISFVVFLLIVLLLMLTLRKSVLYLRDANKRNA